MYENLTDELEPEDLEQFEEEGLTDRPEDYYFALDDSMNENIEGDVSIIITPKKLWDNEGYWSDSGYIPALLEAHLNGYYELLEATFEQPEGMSVEDVRADLTAKGFTENPDLLSIA